MYNPSVSVIVNTHNRAPHLKRLLDCLAHQTYTNFEVIVVNGPSTDGTEEVLEMYKDAIRIETCPEVNLCMSRNIGVCAAAGEILAFIDDDAVPGNNRWLEQLVKPFKNENVAVVGGESYRMNGMHEFCNGTFSVWGENNSIRSCSLKKEEHDGIQFNGVIGCNCAFRKTAVMHVGGFDEYYAYFLDETDLCLRLAQAGFDIVHQNSALVYHEAAGGVNRKSQYHLNWDVIARSRGYFVIKATAGLSLSNSERKEAALKSCAQWLEDFKWMRSAGKITQEDFEDFNHRLTTGRDQGIADGFAVERKLNNAIPFDAQKFKKYDFTLGRSHLNICFLCEDDVINPLGGVAVYTKALAYGLDKMGHNVYVITKGTEKRITNVNGVNICYVVPQTLPLAQLDGIPLSRMRMEFSYACYLEIQKLKKHFYIDLVESPIWDSYGVVASYMEKDIPVATRLQTPLKMMMDTFQMKGNEDLEMLAEYEAALMEKSAAIITISDCVKDTIENLYEMTFTQPLYKNYLGIQPQTLAESTRKENDGKLVVFFIGRLERRKGIDSIIASIPHLMEKYPNLEFRLAGDDSIFDNVIGDTYKNKLIKENRGAKWLKRVHFLGKISDAEKEQEFANCDVFVSPSLYESFGIIFIEAMRYAKPVIGCKVGGMQEVIADGVTGLLSVPGDAESFAEVLDRLLADETLREKMGQAGLARLHEMFTEEKMCKDAETIYRNILASG